MKKSLVLYHKNCPSGDGFGSAFVAWLSLGSTAEYFAMDYGDSHPAVDGRDVYILDLSFGADQLQHLSTKASKLVLLDHHLTAEKNLAGFRSACCGKVHFDLTKCGAILAWEYFFPLSPVPQLLRWIQSRDLWKWDEPDTKVFLTWLDTQPKTFEAWRQILCMDDKTLELALQVGASLVQQVEGMCQAIVSNALPVTIADAQGLMVNSSGVLRSEVGELLAKKSKTFGLVWRVVGEGRVLCSLRSEPGYDVEQLASLFGGGGHVTAASFTLPVSQLTSLALGQVVAG